MLSVPRALAQTSSAGVPTSATHPWPLRVATELVVLTGDVG
jgi:hypothetical protein